MTGEYTTFHTRTVGRVSRIGSNRADLVVSNGWQLLGAY